MATKDITDAQVCAAYRDYQAAVTRNPGGLALWPYERLMAWTHQPEKVCYRAMERAERRGLVEYGVSLRSGWLTEKGLALMQHTPGVGQ